jgi:copper(I)-binding protein
LRTAPKVDSVRNRLEVIEPRLQRADKPIDNGEAMKVDRLIAAAILVMGAASAAGHEFKAGAVTVVHPWARATVAGSTTGAVFLEIKNAPGRADRLLGGKTDAAEKVEIHQHGMEKGTAKMRSVPGVGIPAGKSIVLGPHGYHVMLIGLKSPLKEGDTLPLTLRFERSGEVAIEASVEPADAMGPHGFDHQPGAAKPAHKH